MRRVQTNGKPIRTGTGQRRWRWISYATVDNQTAHSEAMAELRRRRKAEWWAIELRVYNPETNYHGARSERDAVLRERHREEYDELHADYREKLGLPRYLKRRSLVDRRRGRL